MKITFKILLSLLLTTTIVVQGALSVQFEEEKYEKESEIEYTSASQNFDYSAEQDLEVRLVNRKPTYSSINIETLTGHIQSKRLPYKPPLYILYCRLLIDCCCKYLTGNIV